MDVRVGLSEAGPRFLMFAAVGGIGGTPRPVLLNISIRFGVSVVSLDLSSISHRSLPLSCL